MDPAWEEAVRDAILVEPKAEFPFSFGASVAVGQSPFELRLHVFR
jgi:hypothetical protein